MVLVMFIGVAIGGWLLVLGMHLLLAVAGLLARAAAATIKVVAARRLSATFEVTDGLGTVWHVRLLGPTPGLIFGAHVQVHGPVSLQCAARAPRQEQPHTSGVPPPHTRGDRCHGFPPGG